MSDKNHTPDDKPGWADNPTFIRVFIGILTASAIAAGLAGLNPAWQNPHPHFAVEGIPVFFAIYGFVAFAFIVLAGQHLRKLVGRKEEYYDERE